MNVEMLGHGTESDWTRTQVPPQVVHHNDDVSLNIRYVKSFLQSLLNQGDMLDHLVPH